ncbi:MAG TPA: hypothetical protein VFR09_02700 [Alphaproteobacteria bacterium]|nr:hypothetical protein [Alphaproteobacteria bacterium]
MRPIILALSLLFLALPCRAEDHPDLHWLEGYKGQETASVLADTKFKPFFASAVPDYDTDLGFGPHGVKTGLKVALMNVLSGPDDTVMMPAPHNVVISACRENSCREKGLMWIDTENNQSILAIVHYIYGGTYFDKPQLFLASNDFTCGLYPLGAINQIKFWLKQNEITPADVRCLDGHKVSETVL